MVDSMIKIKVLIIMIHDKYQDLLIISLVFSTIQMLNFLTTLITNPSQLWHTEYVLMGSITAWDTQTDDII